MTREHNVSFSTVFHFRTSDQTQNGHFTIEKAFDQQPQNHAIKFLVV